MTTIGRKILSVYESRDTLLGIPSLENLINLPEIRNEELAEATAVDFSHFWTEKSWQNAVTAARGADVIVITLSGSAELPMPVQRWAENWPYRQSTDHTTLVVNFAYKDSECPKQAALMAFFQQIAGLHGLEFICHDLPVPSAVGFQAN